MTGRRRSALLATAALLLCLAVALPGGAGAFRLFGGKYAGEWPGKKPRITYFVAANQYREAAGAAAAAWNRTGVRVRFVEVKSRKRAEVLVSYLPGKPGPGCAGIAYGGPLGIRRPGESRLRYVAGFVQVVKLREPDAVCKTWLKGMVTHEFGHVLGLYHETRTCALMNRSRVDGLWPDRCPAPPEGQWRCRLIELDDARGARKLYGGKLKPPVTPENCPIPGYVPPDDGFEEEEFEYEDFEHENFEYDDL